MYFGVMHEHSVELDVTRSDTPWGLKQPHLQVGGAFKFGVYVDGSCGYLLVNFYLIHYRCAKFICG